MTQTKKYQTQWSAQFFAAAELVRRGYAVTFTLGNAPGYDLVVVSPGGTSFRVDVKGLSSKIFWLIREREPASDLYYILVHITPAPNPPAYFIASSIDLMGRIQVLKAETLAKGKPYPPTGAGIPWNDALPHLDKWDCLPQ